MVKISISQTAVGYRWAIFGYKAKHPLQVGVYLRGEPRLYWLRERDLHHRPEHRRLSARTLKPTSKAVEPLESLTAFGNDLA